MKYQETPVLRGDAELQDWVKNHGIVFLNQVLDTLGHPYEPEETLREVLVHVHMMTDALIINLKDAKEIVEEDEDFWCEEFETFRKKRNHWMVSRLMRGRKTNVH